jgi:hypothetical protein
MQKYDMSQLETTWRRHLCGTHTFRAPLVAPAVRDVGTVSPPSGFSTSQKSMSESLSLLPEAPAMDVSILA